MTAAIVGWAHMPSASTRPRRSRAWSCASRRRRWSMPASRPPTSTRSSWAISTPASARRISPPRWCCRPMTGSASSRRPASRTPAPPVPRRAPGPQDHRREGRAHRARRRRRADDADAGPEIGKNLLKASYLPEDGDTPAGFAGVFGKIAGAYFQKHGDQSDALAMIAAKNHKNGVGNPYAQMRKDVGYDFCRTESEKNPFVAGPFKRTDCSLVPTARRRWCSRHGHGAPHEARRLFQGHRPCAGFPAHVEARHPRLRGLHVAWQRALAQAGVAIGDLSFVETHDCFTIAELIEYEAMGLTKPGEGARAIKEAGHRWAASSGQPVRRPQGQGPSDRRDRRLDACAHRHAAHRRGAGGDPGEGRRLGGIFNMGGVAVANYTSILERVARNRRREKHQEERE